MQNCRHKKNFEDDDYERENYRIKEKAIQEELKKLKELRKKYWISTSFAYEFKDENREANWGCEWKGSP